MAIKPDICYEVVFNVIFTAYLPLFIKFSTTYLQLREGGRIGEGVVKTAGTPTIR